MTVAAASPASIPLLTPECPICKSINREICLVFAELVRAQQEGDWKRANRRRLHILRAKERHEARSGHTASAQAVRR